MSNPFFSISINLIADKMVSTRALFPLQVDNGIINIKTRKATNHFSVHCLYTGFYISRLMAERYGFSLGPAISAVYLFFAVVLFFPCLFLYKFSVKLQWSVKKNI